MPVEADGATRMQLAGADANFGAEAVAEAVRKPRRAVVEDICRIHLFEKSSGSRGILREDSVCVVRTMSLNMIERVVEGVDNADGKGEIEVLGVPFRVGDRVDRGGGQKGSGAFTTTNFHRFFFERADERR